eukprot:866987-Rhodomonas_salina.5
MSAMLLPESMLFLACNPAGFNKVPPNPVPSYARPVECPVLTYALPLRRLCERLPGTFASGAATRRYHATQFLRHLRCGVWYSPTLVSYTVPRPVQYRDISCYVLSGTDLGYAATSFAIDILNPALDSPPDSLPPPVDFALAIQKPIRPCPFYAVPGTNREI